MWTTKDAQADAEDRELLPLHQDPEGVSVSRENGIDEAAVIHGPIVPRCG